MSAVPPKLNSLNTRVWWLLVVAVGLAGATVLYFFNPATHSFYPICQFHRLTGWNCPGCGMTRALHALLRGQFTAAVRDNALLVGLLALGAVRGLKFGWNHWQGRPNGAFFPEKFLGSLLVAAVIFAVLRNLPMFVFLSPAPNT
jgi:hypothetical protein